MAIFSDFDLTSFWKQSAYADREYVMPAPSPLQIASIEAELGYKLPAAYIELMQSQNGGIPNNCTLLTKEPTSWAEDHVMITGIFGIGNEKACSLTGNNGSKFMMQEWGYPNIGVYICDCPSAGHDMICLDYRKNGPVSEPQVVHVDQESDYKITFLAENFERFIRGLVNETVLD